MLIRKKLIDAFLFINLNVSLPTVELSELLQEVSRLRIVADQCTHVSATSHLSHLLQVLQEEYLRLRHLLFQLIAQLNFGSVQLYVARASESEGLVDCPVYQEVLSICAHSARELKSAGRRLTGARRAQVNESLHNNSEGIIWYLLHGLGQNLGIGNDPVFSLSGRRAIQLLDLFTL